jgi:deoxyribodipyrimidine photo-lyase
MLEGLKEVKHSLEKRGIQMVTLHKSPETGVLQLAKKASLAVVDRGYLKIQKAWRDYASKKMDCPLVQVETDVVVPVEETSIKEEYAAATIRSKITRKLDAFLVPLKEREPIIDSLSLNFDSFDIQDVEKAISKLRLERSVKRVDAFHGGTKEAKSHLEIFLESKLDRFPELRNDPTLDYLSHMSPYLHFGQISPSISPQGFEKRSLGAESFLEELIIRRELSMNFVFYNEKYDSLESIPDWAKKTLRTHQKIGVHISIPLRNLRTRTHDPYWNAAQKEMVIKGKMHGYMRMYWGKKILEWSKTPEEAFKTALYLNNKYELDGRDPNGFTGVAWCFGKHDRPWGERAIFGNVRYMNDRGLKRKFDADKYVKIMEPT